MMVTTYQLFNLVKEVWTSICPTDIVLINETDHPGMEVLDWFLMVPIGNNKNNKIVVFGAAEETGKEIAAEMFGKEPLQLSTSDVIDALGEVTNMMAEGAKVLLDAVESVGLPQQITAQTALEQIQYCSNKTHLFALGTQRYLYVAVLEHTDKRHVGES